MKYASTSLHTDEQRIGNRDAANAAGETACGNFVQFSLKGRRLCRMNFAVQKRGAAAIDTGILDCSGGDENTDYASDGKNGRTHEPALAKW